MQLMTAGGSRVNRVHYGLDLNELAQQHATTESFLIHITALGWPPLYNPDFQFCKDIVGLHALRTLPGQSLPMPVSLRIGD